MIAQPFLQAFLSLITHVNIYLLSESWRWGWGEGLHLVPVSLCPNSPQFCIHTDGTSDQLYGDEHRFLA